MRQLLYIIIASLLFTSCDQEIGEITFESEPMLIVNAMLEAESDEHIIQLRMTGVTETTPLPSAEIEVFVNGEKIATTTSDSEYYHFNAKFKASDNVEITVTSKNMNKKAYAQCIVPEPVVITKTSTAEVEAKNHNGDMTNNLRTFISINKTTKGTSYHRLTLDTDQYNVRGYGLIPKWNEEKEEYEYVVNNPSFEHEISHAYYYYSDIALTNGQSNSNTNSEDYIDWLSAPENIYGTFTSAFFDNNSYTLKIDVGLNNWPEYLKLLKFKVRSITSNEYNYLAGVSALHGYESGYLLSNPPVTCTNIEGGTGIFSISTSAEATAEYAHLQHLTKDDFFDYINKEEQNY